MNDITMDDFINVICLRNQLLVVPTDEFVEKHREEERFLSFLDTLAVLTMIDSAFFLFSDELIEKAKAVIFEYRFNYKDTNIVEAINQAILYFNTIRNYDESCKKLLKNGYLGYQEDCRKITIEDENQFLELLAFDAVVYFALAEDKMDIVGDDDAFFLASINYLIESIPELFNDEEIKNRAMKKLEEIMKKGWPFKKVNRDYSKETIENIQKIKTREE